MMTQDKFPESWNRSDTILISKPNDRELRPIYLISSLGKIFEKLVTRRFDRLIELENVIPISHYDFRKE